MTYTVVSQIVLSLLAIAAAYTDLRHMRIPNWLTIGGMTSGVALQTLWMGQKGAIQSIIGAAVGFALLLGPYLIGALGAGDVKLFGAIGALSSPLFAWSTALYSILFAGLIGILILVCKKQLSAKGWLIVNHVMSVIYSHRLEPILNLRQKRDLIRFPFMLAVLPGLAAAIWEQGL